MVAMGESDISKSDSSPLRGAQSPDDTCRAMEPTPPSALPRPIAAPLRVLIVEDHAPTRAAIAMLLEREFPRMVVIGTASNGDAALRAVVDDSPEVVVLDLDLGGENGLDLLPAIHGTPGIAVIILTSSDDLMARPRAFAAGATNFISKLSPAQELISAILAVRPELADTVVLS